MAAPNKVQNVSEKGDERQFRTENVPEPIRILAKITSVKFQILLLAIYISVELFVAFKNGAKDGIAFYVVYYLNDIAFFYLSCLYVLPLAAKSYKKYWVPIILLLITISAWTLISALLVGLFFPGKDTLFGNVTSVHIVSFFWRSIQIFIIAIVIWGMLFVFRLLLKQRILENNYLYSRISPHLLHNCLNYVYDSLNGTSEAGQEMILRLSDFARSAMVELDDDGKTSLANEIEKIEALIAIFNLRMEQESFVQVEVHSEIDTKNFRIPPNVLVSFTENIFKYGRIDDRNFPATIKLNCTQSNLLAEFRNFKIIGASKTSSNSIGIANSLTRLRNIYNDKFSLTIHENDLHFFLSLWIPN